MADPFSTIVGSLQIAGQCATAIIALGRWIEKVATVDQRIRSFCDDVAKLKETYTTLEQCSNSPAVLAAAKEADESTEHLWAHLRTTLQDCQNTLVAINHVLYRINRPLGLSAHLRQFWTPPIRQLLEQLYGGELGRHHEKIKMFNTSLALPMQMIQITLQLRQRDLSQEYHRSLEKQIRTMQGTVNKLNANIAKLQTPESLQRVQTSGSGTLVEEQNGERVVCKNMEDFATCAKQFLSTASSIASSRSGGSTVNPDYGLAPVNPSEGGVPLTQHDRNRIGAWVPYFKEDSTPSVGESEDTPYSPVHERDDTIDTDDEDSELDEVVTYFKHGQSYLARDEFAAAEENFVEALEVLKTNDFGDRIAFQSADVFLMLAHCLVEQDKLDEAIALLLPLIEDDVVEEDVATSGQSPNLGRGGGVRQDLGRTYAAHHSIGNVYLKKQDCDNAVKYGTLAYNGRKKFFGKGHEKTLETVQLVIDAFRAMGKRAKAERWETLLVASNTDHYRKLPQRDRRPSGNAAPAGSATGARPSLSPQTTLTITTPPLNPIIVRRISNDFYPPNSATTNAPPASIFDDTRTLSSGGGSSSIRRASTSTRVKQDLKPKFDAVKILAEASRDKAWAKAKDILKEYDPKPCKILTLRNAELEKNIRKQGAVKGMSATGYGYAPIHFFSDLKTEYPNEVEVLIENGADLMAPCYRAGYGKQDPMTPLQLAISRNHQNIAVLMLDALQALGTVPINQILALKDTEEFSPLLAACRLGQIDTMNRFLDFGANITTGFPRHWRGNSLLHDAASRCDVDMVNLLLSIRTERYRQRSDIGTIDQQDQFGRTPFMYAVMSRNIPDQGRRDWKLKRRVACLEAILSQVRTSGLGWSGSGPRPKGSGNHPDLLELFAIRDELRRDVWSYAREEGDVEVVEVLGRFWDAAGGGALGVGIISGGGEGKRLDFSL